MKIRYDFVTNSSSSSFIITNNTNETLTSEEIVERWFKYILEDAVGRFILEPGESTVLECGDHIGDGEFEVFIHDVMGDWGSRALNTDDVSVEFLESHH